MLVKSLSLLPEILLLLTAIFIQIIHWVRKEQTPKTFASISKIGIILALGACVIFYNLSLNPHWILNSPYTTFFKVLILFITLISNFLGCKWFLSQNYSSHRYYQLICFIVLGLCIAISAQNLALLMLALFFDIGLVYFLVIMCQDVADTQKIRLTYWINLILFSLFFGSACIFLYTQTGTLFLDEISEYYKSTVPTPFDSLAVCLLFAALIFLIGAAPFHFSLLQMIKNNILPAAAFIALIFPIGGLAVLISLFHHSMTAFNEPLSYLLLCCGIISILFGAIGTGCFTNLRQLFFCVGVFNLGIIFVLFSFSRISELQAGIVYFLIYQISMLGIYTCFYGMRYHGEYLNDVDNLSGMSATKPYISAAMLIFIFSLLGFPPLLGLLGNLTLINSLLAENAFYLIGFIFFMLIILAHGLLKVIKSIYFNPRHNHFDRADIGVYCCLLLNILIILISVIHPNYWMYDIEEVIRIFLS